MATPSIRSRRSSPTASAASPDRVARATPGSGRAFTSRIVAGCSSPLAAVGTLPKAMREPATPAATRVRAADATLGRVQPLWELASLEARVVELERVAAEQERAG